MRPLPPDETALTPSTGEELKALDSLVKFSCSTVATVTDPGEQIAQFTTAIFEPEDVAEFRSIKSANEIDSRWSVARDIPALTDDLLALNAKGFNVYVGVNPRKTKDASGDESVALARCLFADFDKCTFADARERIKKSGLPKPTMLVASGHGVHAYWRLFEPMMDLKAWSAIQKHLASVLASDPKICNPERIMRLAGFLNVKGANPVPCSINECNPRLRYRVTELQAILSAAPHKTAPRKLATNAGDKIKEGGRNNFLTSLAGTMRRPGMSESAMLAALLEENQNRCDPPLPKKDVERIARSVSHYPPEVGAAEFQKDHEGTLLANQFNLSVALKLMGASVRYNAWSDACEVEGLPGYGPRLDDPAWQHLLICCENKYHLRFSKDRFFMLICDLARNHRYDPVLDYLNGLKWDMKPRIDTWLSVYGGAEDSAYTRAVGSIILTAAVRRARQPGVKFDEMLVLESPEQGKNKSTAISILAVRPEWTTADLPLSSDTKTKMEALESVWIAEASEMRGLSRAYQDSLKSWQSRTEDKCRLAYGRTTTVRKRRFVLFGTINDSTYLEDMTGNRRYWPVKIKNFDVDLLKRDRDQIWAEAAYRESRGDSIRLDPSLYPLATKEQEARRHITPLEEKLTTFCAALGNEVKKDDVWNHLRILDPEKQERLSAKVGKIMTKLKWKSDRRRIGNGDREWYYVRINPMPA